MRSRVLLLVATAALFACGARDSLDSLSPSQPDGETLDASAAIDASQIGGGDATLTRDAHGADAAPSDANAITPNQQACLAEGCPGCCLPSGQCVAGNSTAACGVGVCHECSPADNCGDGVCQHWQENCGPSNCTGCCTAGFMCTAGNSDINCGRGGLGCLNCTPTESTCLGLGDGGGGSCSAPTRCSGTTCGGCCENDVCYPGWDDDRCGFDGITCAACGPDAVCGPGFQGGTCVPVAPCGPASCSGCCTDGVCATGSQDIACGRDGGACTDCTQSGMTCGGSVCQ